MTVDLLRFASLFPEFRAPSWTGWHAILARVTPAVRELWVVAGRGAGKSRIAALVACAFASREYPRAPGENIFVGIFAPDRKQAGITFKYVVGLLRSVPALDALVVSEAQSSLELSNGVIIEVVTASTAAPRGRSYALAIVEEAAFLPTDTSANPDTELLRALTPGLARVPGSLLVVISSPYARRGELWKAWRRYHESSPEHVVFVQAATRDLNPTFDAEAIARAYEEDPASAAAEYGAAFRSDVESFISREALDACVVPDRLELAPAADVRYLAFVDPSGGSADSFTAAVAHADRDTCVLDAVREIRPPFSPETAVEELCAFLKTYRVDRVVGDRYAGEWVREPFRKRGIRYELSPRPKSDIYRDALPLVNSGRVELLDLPRLVAQLAGLERRTARGGRDSIDHAPGGGHHDDVANAACGALALAEAAAAGPHVGTVPFVWGVGPNFGGGRCDCPQCRNAVARGGEAVSTKAGDEEFLHPFLDGAW